MIYVLCIAIGVVIGLIIPMLGDIFNQMEGEWEHWKRCLCVRVVIRKIKESICIRLLIALSAEAKSEANQVGITTKQENGRYRHLIFMENQS